MPTSTVGGLRTYRFKPEYRSGDDDLVEELYHPALARSSLYWRAVGYFSSSALEAIGEPMGTFVERGGTMKLVTSVELQEEDVRAIQHGLSRKQVSEQRLLAQIKAQFSDSVGRGAALLAALLEIQRLQLKIALPIDTPGIYHEKVGIFLDSSDDYVAFSGSSNESRTALRANYECVDVYPSWSDPNRALAKRLHFERVWDNRAPGVESFDFPEAARRELIRICRIARPDVFREKGAETTTLWPHQTQAIEIFLRERRGILEMATGTGKTRTALEIFSRLAPANITSAIIAADGIDLLLQWQGQISSAAIRVRPRFRVLSHFGAFHQRDEYILAPKHSILLVSRPFLPDVLRRLDSATLRQTLLIHDEVHRLGSPNNIRTLNNLSDQIPFRLGLSATPEREYGTEGNAFINTHIGPVIYRFGLNDAIRQGILCEFDYHPLEYAMDDNDRRRLQSVYSLQARRAADGDPMSDEELWIALARVHKTSRAKLPILDQFLEQSFQLLDRSIIFVAEHEYGLEVAEIIHRHRHDFHTYYSDDPKQYLEELSRGSVGCLITCHRLSEGIDIPGLRSIFLLASDRSRLETVQRLGRCLRTDPQDPHKRASVVDLVRAAVPGDNRPNVDQERKQWLEELSRTRREN